MLKNKSIDYIFGMITGASLMLAFWVCTNTPLGAYVILGKKTYRINTPAKNHLSVWPIH